jgi:hypothetical protein
MMHGIAGAGSIGLGGHLFFRIWYLYRGRNKSEICSGFQDEPRNQFFLI